MPFPKTKSMGTAMSFLKKDKPEWPRKQKIAVALDITGKGKKKNAWEKVKKRTKNSLLNVLRAGSIFLPRKFFLCLHY